MYRRFASIVVLTIVASLAAAPADARTAEESFADGNRLFRADLYWAALLRYSQAAELGMDTPLLHYNTGIAHYRAGQHIRAREALQKALADPALVNVAHYNLGLNAWALGDTDEALRWFRLVRNQQADEQLQRLATVATARIHAAREEPAMVREPTDTRDDGREFTELELRALLGYGQDSNVFRSPDQPYIDYADPDRPLVIPTVQSGGFVPFSLLARLRINSLPFEGFFGAYRLSGRYYLDEELENGNEYIHELSFGNHYERTEGDRERRVDSAFTIAQKDEVYYDPDDGAIRRVDDEDIEDRMNYMRYGPQLYARQSWDKLTLGIDLKAQLWDYEDTGVVPEYDHEYYAARLYGQYKFTPNSLLRVTAEYYSRRFGNRPSYNLDGQQLVGNPGIRYDYLALGIRGRSRLTDGLWFGIDVEHTERTDQYVGYYDYSRDSIAGELHWTPATRFALVGRAVYNLYDFPNAFAFHEPTLAQRTQESLIATLEARFHINRHFSIVAEAHHREVVSNDIRIQYDRTRYLIGVRWRL
ncbi:MAG: tetratricopeptide repeat protein [Woeseiaceae bacterium]|jgi:tetratricopeptide (TPR) repeat protein